MLVAAGIDPPRDLARIVLAGSHSAALEQLEAGQVQAAGASLNAHEKMVTAGALDGKKVVLLARSAAIPAPPIAMRAGLGAAVKQRLRQAFDTIHTAPGVTGEMLLGYGGKKVDRYDAGFAAARYAEAMRTLAAVSDELAGEIIAKAGQQ
jgi:phosphonate transport system substrate-binding protein